MATIKNLEKRVNVAMAREQADIVIKNVNILNAADGSNQVGDIAIVDGVIVGTYDDYNDAAKIIDGTGLTATGGFIDSHVHIESCMVTPSEFDRCVLLHGTTAAVWDPHEIANVEGTKGLEFAIAASENTVMDLKVNLSSCVPASKMETSGANLEVDDLITYRHHENVLGLAEFMNIGGVLGTEEPALAKLSEWGNGHVDGHMPGIRGMLLNAMAGCGICNCHESITRDEAAEKARKGIQILVREGSLAKNADEIGSIITPFNSPWFAVCTDDRNPLDVAKEGHLDHVIRKILSNPSVDPVSVYRAASWSAAQGFGLHKNSDKGLRRGLIAPGYLADIVLLEGDIRDCNVHSVIKDGQIVTPDSFGDRPQLQTEWENSIKLKKVSARDFQIKAKPGQHTYDVIGVKKDDLFTEHLQEKIQSSKGVLKRNFKDDIIKMAVLERHGKNGNIAKAFIKGFGFKEGAIAASVGHDSHNVTVVGATDQDMAVAVNRIRDLKGGYVVVKNGQVLSEVALPVGGLMSDKPYDELVGDLKDLYEASDQLNGKLDEPFMTTAFMALCVIPKLKLTDWGLVRFDPPHDLEPVLIDDQRQLSL